MSRITEQHEEREDHIIVSEEGDGEFVSIMSVSEHFFDKHRTQVAEVWLNEYNVEVLVNELQDWLHSRRMAELPDTSQEGAGQPQTH